jgi:hypothetical protein
VNVGVHLLPELCGGCGIAFASGIQKSGDVMAGVQAVAPESCCSQSHAAYDAMLEQKYREK